MKILFCFLIFVIIYYIFLQNKSNRSIIFVGSLVLLGIFITLISLLITICLGYYSQNLLASVISLFLFIFVIIVSKTIMELFFKTIKYYINKRNIKLSGKLLKGKVKDIKTIYFTKYNYVHYMNVIVENKIVKSLCFLDNIYSVGEEIDVVKYKKDFYVLLKKINKIN